jgi:hypothetical protein
MEIFEKKLKFNPTIIYRMIARQAGTDINGLTEPCYAVHTKKFEATLYRNLGLVKKDISAFVRRTYEGTEYLRFQTVSVPYTVLLCYLYHKYVKANKKQMAEDVLLYILIKFYGSVYEKAFPNFCDKDTFRYTIDTITKRHMFYREKTIANALIYWSKEMNKQFFPIMKEWNPHILKKLIIDLRNRVSQSTKSFAQHYYANSKSGKGIRVEKEPETADQNNLYQTTTAATGKAAIEKFIKSVYVYKSYDQSVVNEAKKISRVKNHLAESILPLIHNKSSEENIKTILTSFLRNIPDLNSLCRPDFNKHVKKIMMPRKYQDTFTFKNLIVKFADSMIASSSDTIIKVSQRDMIAIYLFVAFYIALRFKKLFC